MTETVACDLCGGTKSDRVLVGRDLWLKKPGEFQLVKCAGCGLRYLNPRPTQEELAAYYPATYYSFRADEVKCEMNWRRRLSQRIKDRRDLAGLPRGEPGMKALDVGCGSGGFLATLQTYGWEAYGVEPFEGGRVAKERGLKVHHGTVEDARYPEGNFQFIRLRHVLEHAPNPKQLMRSLAPILARDGLLQVIHAEPWRLECKAVRKVLGKPGSAEAFVSFSCPGCAPVGRVIRAGRDQGGLPAEPFQIQPDVCDQ